jgi:hypothetical protein
MITAIQYTCQVSGVSLVTGGTEKREIMADEFWFRNWPGSGRVTGKQEVIGIEEFLTPLDPKLRGGFPNRCSF